MIFISFFLTLCLLLTGCEEKTVRPEGITVVSFNAQTLFDDIDDGDEFSPFRRYEGWNSRKYSARLSTLRNVVTDSLDADIIFFQEIESEKVLEDLLDSKLRRRGYLYYCVADINNPISVGFISKYKPISVSVHSIGTQRFILRCEFMIDSCQIVFYNLHAKSNLGDDADNRNARRELAALVNSLISSDSVVNTVVLGDFNCEPGSSLDDMLCFEGYYTADDIISSRCIPVVRDRTRASSSVLYDVAADPAQVINAEGTYFFEGQFYDYDRFLLNAKACSSFGQTEFEIETGICFNGHYPYVYDPEAEEGFSDHFPVRLTLLR